MRIVHVITGLETGGAEASLCKLIKHFPQRETEHVVCSLNGMGTYGSRLMDVGVPVHALNGKARTLLRVLPALVRRLKPNLMQGWLPHGNLAAMFCRIGLATTAPILWNIRQSLSDMSHTKPGTAVVIRAGALLSRFCTRIIYNSHIGARQHEAFGYAANKTVIIDNGFDTELFRPDSAARARIRTEIGAGSDVPVIGVIGRAHPMKDYPNFLRAAHEVRATRADAMFILVGRNTQDAPIMDMVSEIGLQESVRLLGERRDIPAIMAAMDISVLSSVADEAFPNVVGEAMACGTPCVVTDVGDSARIVGNTGIVVPPRDSDALACAISHLLDRPDRKTLGQRARERIVCEYSLSAMTSKYHRLYAQIVPLNSGSGAQ